MCRMDLQPTATSSGVKGIWAWESTKLKIINSVDNVWNHCRRFCTSCKTVRRKPCSNCQGSHKRLLCTNPVGLGHRRPEGERGRSNNKNWERKRTGSTRPNSNIHNQQRQPGLKGNLHQHTPVEENSRQRWKWSDHRTHVTHKILLERDRLQSTQ